MVDITVKIMVAITVEIIMVITEEMTVNVRANILVAKHGRSYCRCFPLYTSLDGMYGAPSRQNLSWSRLSFSLWSFASYHSRAKRASNSNTCTSSPRCHRRRMLVACQVQRFCYDKISHQQKKCVGNYGLVFSEDPRRLTILGPKTVPKGP